jgi:hypothetical protein
LVLVLRYGVPHLAAADHLGGGDRGVLRDNQRVSGLPRLRITKNVCQTTKFGIYFVQKVVSSGEK